jgi:hypothetical protein
VNKAKEVYKKEQQPALDVLPLLGSRENPIICDGDVQDVAHANTVPSSNGIPHSYLTPARPSKGHHVVAPLPEKKPQMTPEQMHRAETNRRRALEIQRSRKRTTYDDFSTTMAFVPAVGDVVPDTKRLMRDHVGTLLRAMKKVMDWDDEDHDEKA